MFSYWERAAFKSLLPLRLVTGIIFLTHGSAKLTHMQETIDGFVGMGFSATVAILVTIIEALGGIALILGAFTRLAALGIAIVMAGAIITVHWPNGFFMHNHGYEYSLALIAMCTVLIMAGSGPFAVDQVFERLQKTKLQRHSYDERP